MRHHLIEGAGARMQPRQTKANKKLPLTTSRKALLVNGSDREFRELVHDMLAFAAAMQDMRNRLGQLIGLSGTQYTILISIARLGQQGEELGVNQLADHLHLSGAFVTIEVNKLVAAGLVAKAVNPEDRRRVVLTVTDEAVERLEALSRVQRPANDALFEPLTAGDFKAIRGIVAKLAGTGDRTLRLIEYLAPNGVLEAKPEDVDA
ncbi:MarR family transcriptional regulator [Aquabacter sp. CN5-332]|uniref:MarR family winged helix-turn-helix transcriptional regulator n=1 Tax=Aquabacter sp. CN5-332 TaxID=3156608 RepID=UPI0032B4CFFD